MEQQQTDLQPLHNILDFCGSESQALVMKHMPKAFDEYKSIPPLFDYQQTLIAVIYLLDNYDVRPLFNINGMNATFELNSWCCSSNNVPPPKMVRQQTYHKCKTHEFYYGQGLLSACCNQIRDAPIIIDKSKLDINYISKFNFSAEQIAAIPAEIPTPKLHDLGKLKIINPSFFMVYHPGCTKGNKHAGKLNINQVEDKATFRQLATFCANFGTYSTKKPGCFFAYKQSHVMNDHELNSILSGAAQAFFTYYFKNEKAVEKKGLIVGDEQIADF